jgi:hypothetical protein
MRASSGWLCRDDFALDEKDGTVANSKSLIHQTSGSRLYGLRDDGSFWSIRHKKEKKPAAALPARNRIVYNMLIL